MKNSIKYGVSTWLWESPFNTGSVALFPKIKGMGYDLVEIPVEDPDLIDGEVVRKALEDNGLGPIVCGAFGPTKDLTHKDVSIHQNCFDYIEKCFELCNLWGVDFLAGPMYAAVGKARMLPKEERKREWDLAVGNITKACTMAQGHGLSIALEPLNRFESDMINTAEDVIRFIKDVNHSSAKVLLDGFHMTIEESNIAEAIKLVGDKLLHVQVSENHRGIPGTGLTPWTDFAEGLKAIDYKGAIVIESFTPEIKELAGAVCIWKNLARSQDEFAAQGIEFLKRTFK
ncbi:MULTISPECIES: sugar phosphate isomerase/epimerase [unclassified Arenibacter]|jgi:D-psicose/D-tagatose/L-ribulose 3-epimerase|uniref:sugar phosphate isomerase/epimerase family protein n=1 Tax=unclassified Arenibacter TaxID=2615047 RepID=UPI000E351C75|nr:MULTISPECIES: sugar phosphate isomerase/epimerase family protein [unclassified Arenibacter]MCM4165727.1 sugar phosphate isomerase [Arenibacter sp. A80]RFT54576.1 sugar phosphate isomerase/epimerase [Arenibacter sp. P308M17]